MLFTLFKFLHVATMFMAVSFMLGPQFILRRVARSGDVRAIRAVVAQALSTEMLGPELLAVGAILGLIAAYVAPYSFFATWLVIAYVLFILIGINGRMNLDAWLRKLSAAAVASPDDSPSADLEALVRDRRAAFSFAADILLVVLLVLDMVAKP